MKMQFSYEGSVVDDDLMSEHSLVPASKAKKIVMGRSKRPTPSNHQQASFRLPVVAGGHGVTASPHRGPNRSNIIQSFISSRTFPPGISH